MLNKYSLEHPEYFGPIHYWTIQYINWEWFGILHAAQGELAPKMYFWQYPAIILSFIFEFQLLPFAFILILGTLWSHSYSSLKTGWTLYFIFRFINSLTNFLHFLHFKLIINLLVTCYRSKNISMFRVTQPSLRKSANPKLSQNIHKKL